MRSLWQCVTYTPIIPHLKTNRQIFDYFFAKKHQPKNQKLWFMRNSVVHSELKHNQQPRSTHITVLSTRPYLVYFALTKIPQMLTSLRPRHKQNWSLLVLHGEAFQYQGAWFILTLANGQAILGSLLNCWICGTAELPILCKNASWVFHGQ